MNQPGERAGLPTPSKNGGFWQRHGWRLAPGLLVLGGLLITVLLLSAYFEQNRVPLLLLLEHLPRTAIITVVVGLIAAITLGGERGGLRVTMVLGFLLVSFCPTVVLTLINLNDTVGFLHRNAANSLEESASHNAKVVEGFFHENLENVRSLALLPDFSSYLELSADQRQGSAFENRVLDLLLALQRRDPLNITSCALIDRNGRDLVDTYSADMGLDKGNRDYFREPLRSGRPYVSNLFKAELSGIPSIFFTSPVRNTGGEIIGIFRLRYNASVLQQVLRQRGDVQAPSTRRVRLYDQQRVLYADSLRPSSLFFKAELPTGGVPEAGIFRGREGEEERFYLVQPLQKGRWLLLVDQGLGGYYQAISMQVGNALTLMGVVALGVVLTAAVVGGRLARPLQRLTEAAQAMGGGRLEVMVEGGRDRETRLLAEAFNTMAGRLQRAMDELQRSESNYRLLVENQSDLVVKFDLDGRLCFVSPSCCQVFGRPETELLQLGFADLLQEEDRETMRQATAALGPPPHTAILELRTLSAESWVWFSWSFKALLDEGGATLAIIAAGRDISERKQSEEEQARLHGQLLQAQKMESVGRLAGGIAHDYNNMLNVILGHCELALLRSQADGPFTPNFRAIREAAKRSADLTRRLLAFARRQTIAPRVIDLNVTVGGMLEMLRQLIGEDIDLAWRPRQELWPIKADPSQLDQILANLCVNARDAISGVGKVTIETGAVSFDRRYCADHPGFVPGDFVLLAVSDNGCGMDSETLSRIFEPFFTTKETGKGTGLGLATIYGIVKQNQGFVNVYSEPGRGSTFKVYFPRHLGPEESLIPESSPPSHGGAETVLVVEDERMILEVTMTMLESLGYTVLAASTPAEAVRLAEEYAGTIAILLTDVVMPEMNGKELAGRIAAKRPGLRLVFMSGYTANVIAHHGVLDSGVHFLQKPFTLTDLAAALERTRAVSPS